MVFSRNDLEVLQAGGWEVVVTNGDTTISKPDGTSINDQINIMFIIEEEKFQQNRDLSGMISIYIIVGVFVLFLIFLIINLF